MSRVPSKTVSLFLLPAALLLLAALVVPSFAAGDDGGDSAISAELRAALRAPLDQKIGELLKLEDDQGRANVRGSYFDRFKKIDDETYTVAFTTRTAGDAELKSVRSTLTLKPDTGKKWKIADEKVVATVEGMLYRPVPDDETFHEFDSFSFDREGMKLSASKGSMYLDYWNGKPNRIVLVGDNLSYDYTPPQDTNYYEVSRVLRDMRPKDLVFTPERVAIICVPDDCNEIMAGSFKGLRDSTKEQVDDKVRKHHENFVKAQRENRKESPMSDFALAARPGQRYWSATVKRTGGGTEDHFASLTYNSLAPEQLNFWVTDYGSVYTYYDEETRNSAADPYALELRPDLDGQDYDLVSLKGEVEMAIQDPDTTTCDLSFGIKIKRDLQVVPFQIVQVREAEGERQETKRPSMRVTWMEDGDRNPLTYIPIGAANGYIVLPEPVQAGTEMTVHVKFTNGNSIYKLNPSYSYVSRGGWLPFVRFGDMIDEFDLKVATPDRYQILGVGHKVGEEKKDGKRIAHFRSDSPVTFPTVIFGEYEVDKPKFNAEKLDGTVIPVNIYADRTSTMQYSQWKSQEEAVGEVFSGIQNIRVNSLRPIAEQAANSINLYREIFGVDYPFGKLDLVNDPVGPGFYGQAPASIVYLGSGVFRAIGEVAHGGGANIAEFQESVVAHEVGHQWWGGVVTMANSRHYWFVETLAEYASALYIENLYTMEKDPKKGWEAYMKSVEGWRRNVLNASPMASVQDADTMYSGGPFPGMARTALIYNQGPYAFHILRMTFGDEKFFPFLKKMAQDLAGKEVNTRDLQLVAEESFGGTMEWFFDQWIRGIGLPEYSFNYTTRQAEDGSYIVEGNVKQRIVVGPDKRPLPGKTYRGIVSVTVTGKDKQEYPVRFLVENEETPFAFKVPVEPLDIVLNKNGEMLAHDALVNRDF